MENSAASTAVGGIAPRQQNHRRAKLAWTDEMIVAMLRLRFEDATVARRLQTARSHKQKDIAWRCFAAALTEYVGVPVSTKQIRSKYAKVKAEHTKFVTNASRAGSARPPSYIGILREWFADRDTEVVRSTRSNSSDSMDNEQLDGTTVNDEQLDGTTVNDERPSIHTRVSASESEVSDDSVTLASALRQGLQAIALAIKHHEPPTAITTMLREHHEQQRELTQRLLDMQHMQTMLMQQMLQAIQRK